MRPITSTSNSRPIFPDHVHYQTDFDNPFINGGGIIYLDISNMSSLFKCLQDFKVAYRERQLESVIFGYTSIIVGS